ncbi:MAG: hypothetical protein ACLFVS_03765 [Candidatus Acetothermia bacterium]
MRKGLYFFLVVIFIFSLGSVVVGETLTGSWKNKITLTPRAEDLFSDDPDFTSSVITLNYSVGELGLRSESTFDLTGFSSQVFDVSGNLGEIGFSSELSLDASGSELDSWDTTASFTESGLTISGRFLLKKVDVEFGSGTVLTVSGSTADGLTVDVSNYFGMDEDDNIVTDDVYGPSSLQYVSTILDVNGLSLGCTSFDNETKFSEANGFEYTKFEFYIYPDSLPLTLSTTLEFSPDKDITISPSLDLDWACFDVYTELGGDLTGSNDTIDSLTINGFSLTSQKIGGVSLSAYSALGDKTVYDLNSDLLKNYSYSVGSTTETVTFNDAVLLDIDNGLELDLDAYLDLLVYDEDEDVDPDASLLKVALLKGVATFEVSDQFDLGTEFYVLSDVGLDRLGLLFEYSF